MARITITETEQRNQINAMGHFKTVGILAALITLGHGMLFFMWAMIMKLENAPLDETRLALVTVALTLTGLYFVVQNRREIRA